MDTQTDFAQADGIVTEGEPGRTLAWPYLPELRPVQSVG
jgi:hypothetical protein